MSFTTWWKDGGACIFWSVFCVIGVILTLVLVPLSIFDVSHDEYAIRYSDLTKEVEKKVYEEGKYLFTPQTKLFIYNKIVKTISFKDLICSTGDGVEVTLNVDVQYQLLKDELFNVFWEYGKEKYLKNLIVDTTLDSVRDVCGQYNYTDFPDDRDGVESDMETTLKTDISNTDGHAEIQFFQLVNYDFSETLNDAIDNKQLALQDIENAENEREGELTEAETSYETAEIQAETLINQAEGTATATLTTANEEATSIEEVWENRKDTYRTLMDEMGMDADEFVTEYLYGVVIENHKKTYTGV